MQISSKKRKHLRTEGQSGPHSEVFLKLWLCGMDEAAVKIILHDYFGLFLIDDDGETSCIFFLVNLYGEVFKCALHII